MCIFIWLVLNYFVPLQPIFKGEYNANLEYVKHYKGLSISPLYFWGYFTYEKHKREIKNSRDCYLDCEVDISRLLWFFGRFTLRGRSPALPLMPTPTKRKNTYLLQSRCKGTAFFRHMQVFSKILRNFNICSPIC